MDSMSTAAAISTSSSSSTPVPPLQSCEPSQPCTVFITGEVNSGKSSFLNALAGGLVSNVSLQRETFNPIWYQFSDQGSNANLRRISEQLEKVHLSNEKSRRNVQSLTEEAVSTTLKITDDGNELPVRYDLSPINVIDFPGINDAEDAEQQLFFTAICNRINEADLVIFVTDAMTAFSKASEIAEFRRIEKLVVEENDQGHFVELIIVVNKFDETDDTDLQEIYQRIFQKLPELERNKVFCFSSHKMLIDNVIRNQLDLYLPRFNKQELQRILKNCNVQLTPEALKRIKEEKMLRHSDITIQGDFGDLLPDDEEEAVESQVIILSYMEQLKSLCDAPKEQRVASNHILNSVHPNMKLSRSALTWLLTFQDRLAYLILHESFGEGAASHSQERAKLAAIGNTPIGPFFPAALAARMPELQKHAWVDVTKRCSQNGANANLIFALPLVDRWLHDFVKSLDKNASNSSPGAMSPLAGMALSVIVEYFTAELLEVSGNLARAEKADGGISITFTHLKQTLENDDELKHLVGSVMHGVREPASQAKDLSSGDEAWIDVEENDHVRVPGDMEKGTQQSKSVTEDAEDYSEEEAEKKAAEEEVCDKDDILDYPEGDAGDQLRLLNTRPYFHLVSFLKRFQMQLNQLRVDAAVSYLDYLWQELETNCKAGKVTNARASVDVLMNLLSRFESLGAKHLYVDRLLVHLQGIGQLHTSHLPLRQTLHDIVKVFLVFIWHNSLATSADNGILSLMQQQAKAFAIDIHQTFAYFFITEPRQPSYAVTWNHHCKEWLRFVGSDPITFEHSTWTSFNRPDLHESARFIIDKKIQWPDSETENGLVSDMRGAHANPVIQHLLHRTAVPIEMQMLLKLAISPLAYINELDRSKQLPYKVLNEFQPDFLRSLRLLMLQPALFDPTKSLNHRFFSLRESFPQLKPHNNFLLEWSQLSARASPELFREDEDDDEMEAKPDHHGASSDSVPVQEVVAISK